MRLNTLTITVTSVTYAIKAKKILERAGVKSEITKLEDLERSGGCTYGVKIKAADHYRAVAALNGRGIKYSII